MLTKEQKLLLGSSLLFFGCNFVTQNIKPVDASSTPTGTGTGTSEASSTPNEFFGTATGTAVSPDTVWLGQASFNNFREGQSEKHAMAQYMFTLANKREIQENLGSNPGRGDSALTALVNEYKGPAFDAVRDPLEETGMELSSQEIRDMVTYDYVLRYFNENPELGNLMHQSDNNPNKKVISIWGPAHDRDAMTAIVAAALDHETDRIKGRDVDDGTKLMSVISFANDATTSDVRQFQDEIVARTSNSEFETSQSEAGRRRSGHSAGEIDASSLINVGLQRPDQFDVCEEVRDTPLDSSRSSQPQTWINVDHLDDGAGTVKEASVEDEQLGFIAEIDTETGEWDVVGITSRGFSDDPFIGGNAENAVSGNELLPCGVGEAPTPTKDVRPPKEATPTKRPREITVTPGATQPPQATRTEGGNGETPVVPTPQDTPKPTEQVPPTVPPPAEPSSTPSF